MESSILSSVGLEIIGVMSPVSICMLLVVLIVYSTTSSSSASAPPIRTAANLVYIESPSDTVSQKLEGALLNALVFVILIAIVTFLLVLLYYYNCTNFLKNYMRFSAFFVLGTMGAPIFFSFIEQFSIPVDSITCFLLLFNFTIVGVLSIFSSGIPILLRQGYTVSLGIIVAAWFTKLPEWTTWVTLVALAVYDLVAVLAPGGPLKILVELASSRDEELPALVYEARPTPQDRDRSSLGLLIGEVSGSPQSGSVELQALLRDSLSQNEGQDRSRITEGENWSTVGFGNDREASPSMAASNERQSSSGVENLPMGPGRQDRRRESEVVADEEMSPLVEMSGYRPEREQDRRERDRSESPVTLSGGIKLGLGDFVFYSVLVGRAAMYDMMTVFACYLAIISGLACTLILLSVCRKALPALPISIALGVVFYFLTRLLMEPFVVGTSTNLLMF